MAWGSRGYKCPTWDHPGLIRQGMFRNTPCRIPCLCQSRGAPGGCQQNVATNYLTDSRRRNAIFSGRITAIFDIIASSKSGGEAKLVQPGLFRARISYPVKGGVPGSCPTEGVLRRRGVQFQGRERRWRRGKNPSGMPGGSPVRLSGTAMGIGRGSSRLSGRSP